VIVLVDYGGGNVPSVSRALERLGAAHRMTSNATDIAAAEKVILPGVGHFGSLMRQLDDRGLRQPIREFVQSGRPFLGICVGLQALFEGSEEDSDARGLGLLKGVVRRLPPGQKVPHVGWSPIECLRPSRLLAGVGLEPAFYFTHSYAASVTEFTTYAGYYPDAFTAVVERENVFGAQFHPEKSGRAGLAVLRNFLTLPRVAPVAIRRSRRTCAPARRIIPCLDVHAGRVVKGVRFVSLRDSGDPAELAAAYNAAGADELVLLDISASSEGRPILIETVRRVARELSIPFAVGGGVRSVADGLQLLEAGADKVAVNTAAVENPELITELASASGSQAVIAAIDARRVAPADGAPTWQVYTHGGRQNRGRDAVRWALEVEARGAGEILLTSMDRDGTKAGFDCELLAAVSSAVNIPVIASGGGGEAADFVAAFTTGRADAALAASIFHFGELSIGELKHALAAHDVPVRLQW
jgi:imidazole glycerol phosphate synthase glutamine amidotransferase subunit